MPLCVPRSVIDEVPNENGAGFKASSQKRRATSKTQKIAHKILLLSSCFGGLHLPSHRKRAGVVPGSVPGLVIDEVRPALGSEFDFNMGRNAGHNAASRTRRAGRREEGLSGTRSRAFPEHRALIKGGGGRSVLKESKA